MNIPGRKYFRDEVVLGDWFPRGGDDGVFRIQKIKDVGNSKLTLSFLTKNVDDMGDGDVLEDGAGSPIEVELNAADADNTVKQVLVLSEDSDETDTKGFKELVRVKLECDADGSGSSSGDWVLARLFPPIFFDDATRFPSRGLGPEFIAAATTVQHTGATSHTVALPGHANGDLLVMAFACTGLSSPAFGPDTPSGWTQVENVEAGDASAVRLNCFTKVGNGTDSSVTITSSDEIAFGAVCCAYRGASSTVDVSGTAEQESGVDMTAPSVTTTVGNTRVIHMFVFDGDASTEDDVDSDAGFQGTLRGYTETGGPSQANGLAMAYSDLLQASSGSSDTCVFSTNGDDDAGVAITLALAPSS